MAETRPPDDTRGPAATRRLDRTGGPQSPRNSKAANEVPGELRSLLRLFSPSSSRSEPATAASNIHACPQGPSQEAKSGPPGCHASAGTPDQQTKHLVATYSAFAQQNLWRHAVTAVGCGLVAAGILSLSVHFALYTSLSSSSPPSFLDVFTPTGGTGQAGSPVHEGQSQMVLPPADEGLSLPRARKGFAAATRGQGSDTSRPAGSFVEGNDQSFTEAYRMPYALMDAARVRGLPPESLSSETHAVQTLFAHNLRQRQLPRRHRGRSTASWVPPPEGSQHETLAPFAFLARPGPPSPSWPTRFYPGEFGAREGPGKPDVTDYVSESPRVPAPGSGTPSAEADLRSSEGRAALLLCGLAFLGGGAALASVQLVWLLARWIDNLLFAIMAPINRNSPCVLKAPDIPLPPVHPELGQCGPLLSQLLQMETTANELNKSQETLAAAPGSESDSEAQLSAAGVDSCIEGSESNHEELCVTEWEKEMDGGYGQQALCESGKGTGLEGQ